jgi:alcohol dehydrogenase
MRRTRIPTAAETTIEPRNSSARPTTDGFDLPAGKRWQAQLGDIRVLFGSGRLAELGPEARRLEARRVLLVSDPGLREVGHLQTALESLQRESLQPEVFDAVSENPSTREVEAGRAFAAGREIDCIAALGGGSAMDCAKGINFLLTNTGRMKDYWGYGKATRPMLPSLGVPTTAGTGSEAQSYALISDAETHRKMACGDPGARFRTVLLDPDLLATVPGPAAAAAGLDAVSHAIESHVSVKSNPRSRRLSLAAWRRLARSLDAALAGGSDEIVRADQMLGAHLAGAAIEQSMLGAAHAGANPLTARYAIRHGEAVALMLPAVVRFNGPRAGDGYRELAKAAGLPEAENPAESLATFIERLRSSAGLARRLRDRGVERQALPELAAQAAEEWTGRFNPRPVKEADFRELYETAY